MLNDHCQVCEFRQRCHEEADGQGRPQPAAGRGREGDRRSTHRKGIFTLTQLSCTFRAPEEGQAGEAAEASSTTHALQALAIREKKVHVLRHARAAGRKPARIYLDVEGDPDGGFVYLLGVIVVEATARRSGTRSGRTAGRGGADLRRSSWTCWTAPRGLRLCYLRQLREGVPEADEEGGRAQEEVVDRVLARTVNVLSVIYAARLLPDLLQRAEGHRPATWASRWTEPDASGLQSLVWRSAVGADRRGGAGRTSC